MRGCILEKAYLGSGGGYLSGSAKEDSLPGLQKAIALGHVRFEILQGGQ